MRRYEYIFSADELSRINSACYTMLEPTLSQSADWQAEAEEWFLSEIQEAYPSADITALDGQVVRR